MNNSLGPKTITMPAVDVTSTITVNIINSTQLGSNECSMNKFSPLYKQDEPENKNNHGCFESNIKNCQNSNSAQICSHICCITNFSPLGVEQPEPESNNNHACCEFTKVNQYIRPPICFSFNCQNN